MIVVTEHSPTPDTVRYTIDGAEPEEYFTAEILQRVSMLQLSGMAGPMRLDPPMRGDVPELGTLIYIDVDNGRWIYRVEEFDFRRNAVRAVWPD